MTEENPSFFSFDGEMGRIDFWGSYIFRTLIAGLIFFVIFALIFRGYFNSSYEELSAAITQWANQHAITESILHIWNRDNDRLLTGNQPYFNTFFGGVVPDT